ncbi:MAG: hypothetical protein Q7S40_30570 [Opitutaceae bacterium]|nr:hypothetical protein [Opitutaceae bacterium]
MEPDIPFFQISLNLPHAGRIVHRIARLLPSREKNGHGEEADGALKVAVALVELLNPFLELDENPPGEIGRQVAERAAALGRKLVDHIERGGFGGDRLGQCVRNLFECLELGREGAINSLRAGENPASVQRPI